MLAALLEEVPSRSLAVSEVHAPSLRSGEVRISVEICGICGTDLHILDGDSYAPELPFVMGHEPAGIVVQVADDGDASWVGRRVVPHLFVGCRACEWCRAGDERLCALISVSDSSKHYLY